jgi:hypothetical protein
VLYYFDESLRRYRRTNGRYVSDAEIESIAKKLEDESFATLDKSLADLKSEKIKLRQWAEDTQTRLEILHQQNFLLGRGGVASMTQADRDALSRRIKEQLDFFDRFVTQLEAGVVSEREQRARARLYIRAASQSRLIASRRVPAGENQERRVLADVIHCRSCEAFAARGWVPVGTLPDIGTDCECGSNCRCRFEWRVRLVRGQ